jgi:hypothetical protein
MIIDRRQIAGCAAALAIVVLSPACAEASEAGGAPLPASSYSVHSVCPAPAPGHAACMAEQLVPETPQARARTHPLGVARLATRATGPAASGAFGLRPEDLHRAYSLPTDATETQTIALVDAYNDPTIEEDLGKFDTEFSLPECTSANGCFEKVGQNGEPSALPFPETAAELKSAETACKGGNGKACELVREAKGWTVEISLDVETAHSICQTKCKIVLVEADSDSDLDLEEAERTAERLHATEISNSWGGPECIGAGDCAPDSSAFNDPGTVITASAGDDGFLNWLEEAAGEYANFPAASPRVVAVGGTRLELGARGEWAGESVWNDGGENEEGEKEGHGAGGGGCSVQFEAQPWQQEVSDWHDVGCGHMRAVADVSADADPYTGVAVYDSSGNPPSLGQPGECDGGSGANAHWCTIGGTSLASPLIASTFALAGGAHGVAYPARTLYENVARTPSVLHDVTTGSNGECRKPFEEPLSEEEFPKTGCEVSEEALSCNSTLICQAGPGYDGPTGLGTPDDITAFVPLEGETSGNAGGAPTGGSTGGPGPVAGQSAPAPTPAATPSTPAPRISGLALTLKALIALNANRPRLAKLGFAFVLNVAARVQVSLQRHTTKHHRSRWAPLSQLAINALAGQNLEQLSGRGRLSPGSYRLSLTPAHGAAESLDFKIG